MPLPIKLEALNADQVGRGENKHKIKHQKKPSKEMENREP